MADLNKLQSDAETKQQEAIKAQAAAAEAMQAADEADTAHRTARTASYDKELVQTARDWGINPDNFDTQESLQLAVDNFPDEDKPKPAEVPPKLTPELVADAEALGIDVSNMDDDETLKNAIFKAEQKKQENPDIAPAE